MKKKNRPELKVGDRVRFRSDGEIGELNRSQNLNTEIFHTVKKICKDGMVYHEGGGAYAQVQFDICNDLSGIQVGDKVETYWKHGIITDTVVSVSENDFKLEICKKIGCKLSISKADGIHGNFRNRGDFWSVLRIVDKAKPKPQLKPCPFCGGEVKMYKEEFDYGRFTKVIIEHRKDEDQETCIRFSYLTAEDAIRHWNKRETDA